MPREVHLATPVRVVAPLASQLQVELAGGVGFIAVREPLRTVFELSITDRERQVFTLLLDTVEHYQLNTTVRVAGGWVRDRLLGGDSDDLDIALDNMTGAEFAEKVSEYGESQGVDLSSVGLVTVNIEQSKHLETACLTVYGLHIDMTNLRTETYTDTRIPDMRMGTAPEDASRRDFTINALFYNLHTEKIEDFVGGLPDLVKGELRTPMRAHHTLQDDPLRVLRAVRFSSRYGFQLQPQVLIAARKVAATGLMSEKVSRNRVGMETHKMLGSGLERGVLALELLSIIGLHDDVFKPAGCTRPEAGKGCLPACRRLSGLDDPAQARTALYATYLAPMYETFVGKDPLVKIVLDGLKLSKEDVRAVLRALDGAAMLRDARDTHRMADIGQVLLLTKEQWVVSWRVAEALRWFEGDLHKWVREVGLDGCWTWKPVLGGKELQEEFGVRQGPEIGLLIEEQIRWKLEHPLSTVEERRAAFEADHSTLMVRAS
jgi:tRNA nucleotidyltransferase/poly(A) polymerase